MTRAAPPVARRNLVFARVGRASLHRLWLAEPPEERNWDLQLSTWLPGLAQELDDGDFATDLHTGVKFTAIAHYFRTNPHLLDEYEFVMLADDDLLFDAGGISRLFDICRQHDLTIAQPALRPSSFMCHPIVMECPRFRFRYVNFVEAMGPIIRTQHLRVILDYLERWPTGWGINEVWALLMPRPEQAAAVIDCEPMLHLRPHASGDIYASFTTLGMNPRRELDEVREMFSNSDQGKRVYGGVLASGTRLGAVRANWINGRYLLTVAAATRHREGVRRTGLGMLYRGATAATYRPKPMELRSPMRAGAYNFVEAS